MAKKTFIFLFLSILFLFSCGLREKWCTSTLFFFDTVCEVKIFSSSALAHSAQQEVHRIFSEIETVFSPNSTDCSSPVVLKLFRRSLQIYRDSNGCFDITVAPLSKAYGFFKKPDFVPTPQEIKSLLNFIGMHKIKVKNKEVLLPPGMKLDWGGIAKGLGVDLASQSLMAMGIQRGFINSGGDLYCWGRNPEDHSWQIGIKHPREQGFIGVLSLSNSGAATTGDYQRYFELNGVRYHHVLNPHTGYPAQNKQSVTVIGPETTICDALSTALFVSHQPEKILQKYKDYGVVIVNSAGKILVLGKPYPFNPLSTKL